MRRRKRTGDEDEDGTVVEAFHDLAGGAASYHHVIHPAHGEQQHTRTGEDAEKNQTGAITPAALQQHKTENTEKHRPEQVADGAKRFVEPWKVVKFHSRL
jgi:hypothetical protein